jgi:ribonuclease HI
MILPNEINLYFDGSCFPKNPGGVARYGWRLLDKEDKEITSDNAEVCRGPEATNNVAEWAGVINGLRYLKKNNWSGKLNIFGDSQLVINQLNGEYKVRKETLVPYHNESMEILKKWEWSAHWIPREKNEHCDKLSRKS